MDVYLLGNDDLSKTSNFIIFNYVTQWASHKSHIRACFIHLLKSSYLLHPIWNECLCIICKVTVTVLTKPATQWENKEIRSPLIITKRGGWGENKWHFSDWVERPLISNVRGHKSLLHWSSAMFILQHPFLSFWAPVPNFFLANSISLQLENSPIIIQSVPLLMKLIRDSR